MGSIFFDGKLFSPSECLAGQKYFTSLENEVPVNSLADPRLRIAT